MAEEGLRKTENDLIHIGCPIPFDTDQFLQALGGLMDAAYRNKKDIRERVAAVVSTYTPERIPDPLQGTQKDSSTSVVRMKIHPYEKAENAENAEKAE